VKEKKESNKEHTYTPYIYYNKEANTQQRKRQKKRRRGEVTSNRKWVK